MQAVMARVFTGMAVALAGLMAGCVSTPEMPPLREGALPESAFLDRPWASRPPVDIAGRLRAAQRAVGAMQQSVNAYSASLKAYETERNRSVFLQAELARQEAQKPGVERRRGNFATRGTPAEIDAAGGRALREVNPGRAPNPVGAPRTVLTPKELGGLAYDQARFMRGWLHSEWDRMPVQ